MGEEHVMGDQGEGFDFILVLITVLVLAFLFMQLTGGFLR
jgi:hypothetical protein